MLRTQRPQAQSPDRPGEPADCIQTAVAGVQQRSDQIWTDVQVSHEIICFLFVTDAKPNQMVQDLQCGSMGFFNSRWLLTWCISISIQPLLLFSLMSSGSILLKTNYITECTGLFSFSKQTVKAECVSCQFKSPLSHTVSKQSHSDKHQNRINYGNL